MKTIWKYILELGTCTISMPVAAKVLAIQTQNNYPCIWAEVESNHSLVGRKFITIGTGHKIPDTDDDLTYIGTFQMDEGMFVFHVYEMT